MISVSLELFVLRFCFVDPNIENKRPKDKDLYWKSFHIRMDRKLCIHPPFKNSTSVGTKSQRKLVRAYDISHKMHQLIPIFLIGRSYPRCKNCDGRAGIMYCLLVSYKVFGTRLWKNPRLFHDPVSWSPRLSPWRLLGEALDLVPFHFGIRLLKGGEDLLNATEHGDPHLTTNSLI